MSEMPEGDRQVPAPAVQYRTRVEGMSIDFLRTMIGSQAAQDAAGRVALAFRAAAIKEPKLYGIPPEQVARSIALCAMTGLMPAGPLAEVELIPRGGSLDWQVTARGWRKLAERAGWTLDAVPVYAGELFRAPRGLHGDVHHEPDYDTPPTYDRLRLFYVTAEKVGERPRFKVMSKSQIEERRKKAQTQTIWNQWPLEMAEKTAISYAVRRGIVPLDPMGMSAADDPEDLDDGVIEAAPAQAPQLPGPAPSRGMAGLAAALDETPAHSPPPSVSAGGLSPASAPAPAAGDETGAPPREGGPAPKVSKAEREQAEDDAKKLGERMVTKAPGSRVKLDDARALLREATGLRRVSDERYTRALDVGAAAGRWTRDGGDLVIGGGEPLAETAAPAPDRWTDLGGDELLEAMEGTSVRVGDAASERAKNAAGFADWSDDRITEQATDEQLRAIGRALDIEEAAFKAAAEAVS